MYYAFITFFLSPSPWIFFSLTHSHSQTFSAFKQHDTIWCGGGLNVEREFFALWKYNAFWCEEKRKKKSKESLHISPSLLQPPVFTTESIFHNSKQFVCEVKRLHYVLHLCWNYSRSTSNPTIFFVAFYLTAPFIHACIYEKWLWW